MSNTTRYVATRNPETDEIVSTRSSKTKVYTHARIDAETGAAFSFHTSAALAAKGDSVPNSWKDAEIVVVEVEEIDGATFRAAAKARKARKAAREQENIEALVAEGFVETTAGDLAVGTSFVAQRDAKRYGAGAADRTREVFEQRDGYTKTGEFGGIDAEATVYVRATPTGTDDDANSAEGDDAPAEEAHAPAEAPSGLRAECYHCGETGFEGGVGVELSNTTNRIRFEDEPTIPESESQGWWSLCPTCAASYRATGNREVPDPFFSPKPEVRAKGDGPTAEELVSLAADDLRDLERDLRSVDALRVLSALVETASNDSVSVLSDAGTKRGEIALDAAAEFRGLAGTLERVARNARATAEKWAEFDASARPSGRPGYAGLAYPGGLR